MSASPSCDELIATFSSIAGCDSEFAASWLEASAWNLDVAVSTFMDNSGSSGSAPANSTEGGGLNPVQLDSFGAGMLPMQEERAPVPQFRDTLIDPALHTPQRMPQFPRVHPQEAFRDFTKEVGSAPADQARGQEVFGLMKRPKNLAEIYAAPTELCFVGTFEELRDAGRAQARNSAHLWGGKWLLVNIQSPIEFGSQKLNADTWRDETLRAIIGASFLFWQQYYDSPEGHKYCQRYLNTNELPHIGVVDPITGRLVKTWSGFKDAERLMDKLTEYADDPPQAASDPFEDPVEPKPPVFAGGGQSTSHGMPQQQEFPATIAAFMQANSQASNTTPSTPPSAVMEADPEPEVSTSHYAAGMIHLRLCDLHGPAVSSLALIWQAEWPEPLPDATGQSGAVLLAVRLPNGSRFQRAYPLDATLQQVFCAIHHCSGHKLKARPYQLTTMGSPPFSEPTATLASLGLVGRLAVNLAEA
ncbi:MAG: hypothetical protein SGPRY_014723 [Prymnesium sp.]